MLLNRTTSGLTTALVLLAIGAGFVIAQDQPNPPPNAPPAAQGAPQGAPNGPQQPPMRTFRAKEVLGSKVNIQDDMSVGIVDDIVMDEQGNVEYLIVAKSNQQLVTVPWQAARFNVDDRVAVVQITPKQFQQVPTYTVKQYPVFSTPAYRTQIYGFYGLTPAQERRAIRRGAVAN